MQQDGMYVVIELLDAIRVLTSAAETTKVLSTSTLSLPVTSEEGEALSRKFLSVHLHHNRGSDVWYRCANILGKIYIGSRKIGRLIILYSPSKAEAVGQYTIPLIAFCLP